MGIVFVRRLADICPNQEAPLYTSMPLIDLQGLGTRRVLLTIAAAQRPKTTLIRCISPSPPLGPQSVKVPPGIPALPSIQPCFVQYIKSATSPSDEGRKDEGCGV